VWWRERPVPGVREDGDTQREAHGLSDGPRGREWRKFGIGNRVLELPNAS
jgi:hypothetical protein